MTVEPRLSAKELFLAAREIDAPLRAGFLREKCRGDDALRRRVEALLRAETAMGAGDLSPAPSALELHDEIDRYELLAVIGEGGFGAVYRARRRGVVGSEVAVKVLRAGPDSAEAMARFGLERQAMEAMDHPGIARVIDAGQTRAGRPFIVMELVRGEPITTFCDRERLTVEDRAALMAEVCRAVQHAHHKGVIHRDLKPANILAWRSEGRNFAKVIDFGVAKPRHGSTSGSITLTGRSGPIGTLAYMSPEQVHGGKSKVDTRADVYALGAVLYEILSGTPVLDPEALAAAGPAELERLICEVIPPAPSVAAAGAGIAGAAVVRGTTPPRLIRALRGELDWITMRALEKEPLRRYQAADALAADLESHLAGGDITAAPPSRWYAVKRSVRRNRALFSAASVALFSMAAATVWSMQETGRARAAETEAKRQTGIADENFKTAQEQQAVAEAVTKFFTKNLLTAARVHIAGGDEASRELTVREVLEHAGGVIAQASAPGGYLHGRHLIQAELHVVMSDTYFDLGVVERERAEAAAALEALRAAGAMDHRLAVRARKRLGSALEKLGKSTEALSVFEENFRESTRLFGAEDGMTLEAERQLANFIYNSGGDLQRVYEMERHNYETFLKVNGPDDSETLFTGHALGQTMSRMGRHEEAEEFLTRIVAAQVRVHGPLYPDTLWAKHALARVIQNRGREGDAIRAFREVIEGRVKMNGPDHPDTLQAMEELGHIHLRARRLEAAREILQPVYEGWTRVYGADHEKSIRGESALGETLARLGDYDKGMPLLEDAEARMNRVHGDEMTDSNWVHWRVPAAKKARAQGSWAGLDAP